MDFERRYRVDPKDFKIADASTNDADAIGRREAQKIRDEDIQALDDLQERLYAEGRRSLLIIMQALDAAGKDSTIEHVMKGVNPQGVRVVSFKQPTHIELDHDFLWRCQRELPRAGEIGIFNRSQYEDVLVARVHPELLAARGIDPKEARSEKFWNQRLKSIADWERYLVSNGTEIVKFFLHISLDEQRDRLLARAEQATKNWKFSPDDVAERAYYGEYQHAYQETLRATATKDAPWYVIPADHKWLMRTAVASIIRQKLEHMDPKIREMSDAERDAMEAAVKRLNAEG